MSRASHPNRAVGAALREAEKRGFRVQKAGRSSWGRLYAPDGRSIMSIWSTPRSAGNHARQIQRFVDRVGGEG